MYTQAMPDSNPRQDVIDHTQNECTSVFTPWSSSQGLRLPPGISIAQKVEILEHAWGKAIGSLDLTSSHNTMKRSCPPLPHYPPSNALLVDRKLRELYDKNMWLLVPSKTILKKYHTAATSKPQQPVPSLPVRFLLKYTQSKHLNLSHFRRAPTNTF